MTLYTQPSCPQCKMVHRLLDEKKINYEEVVITPENIDVYSAQGIKHTPLLILDNGTDRLIGKTMFDYIKNLEAAK